MNDFPLKMLIAGVIALVVGVLAIIAIIIMNTIGLHECIYTTFNGEIGEPNHCYISRGSIFCEKDGDYVQVESYKEKQ